MRFDGVVHGFDATQERIDSAEFFAGQFGVGHPRHDGEAFRSHFRRTLHGVLPVLLEALNELGFAHFPDAGIGVRRDVGADGFHGADPERFTAREQLAG